MTGAASRSASRPTASPASRAPVPAQTSGRSAAARPRDGIVERHLRRRVVSRRRAVRGDLGAQQIGGDLEVDRPRRRGQHVAHRRRGGGRHLVGGEAAMDRLDHRREHRPLVGGLVQHAAVRVGAPQRRRDVGRDDQDRRPRRPRLADGAERVRRPGPGGRDRDTEPPGRARVAVGRVGRRLLVPHADQPDPRVAQRLPQRQVVDARQPEADLDAAVLEQVDDETRAGGHGAHPVSAGAPSDGRRAAAGPCPGAGGPAGCGRSARRRTSSGGRGATGRSA